MIKFSPPARPSEPDYGTETARPEKSVTAAPATLQQRFSTAAQQLPAKAVSKTKEHPLLKKIQRFHGGSNLSDVRQGKLFHVVNALCDKFKESISVQELERIVPNATVFKNPQQSNGFFDIYISSRFSLPDSYVVNELEARVSNRDPEVRMLILNLDETPIQPETVEKQYGKLRCQLPRGESPEEMISYICTQPWGELRFGYSQRSPELLKSIVFDKMSRPLAAA